MKKFVSVVLSILIVFSMVPYGLFVFASAGDVGGADESVDPTENMDNVDTWDGSVTECTVGSGTEDDPYIILTAENLAYISDITNNKYNGKEFYCELAANIDLRGKNWTPIGKNLNCTFAGHFYGNGYTVLYDMIETNSVNRAGLFGKISGSVQDINIIIGYEYIKQSCDYAGGAIAESSGSVINVHVSGDIESSADYFGGVVGKSSGTVENCSFSGTIYAEYNDNASIGGAIGFASKEVKTCYSEGSITLKRVSGSVQYPLAQIGGLIGESYANVMDCFSTSDINCSSSISGESLITSGGLIGCASSGNVTRCYATGDVYNNVSNPTSSDAGGLIGLTSSGSVTYCYATGNVSSLSSNVVCDAGKLIAENYHASISNCYVNASSTVKRTYSYTQDVGCGNTETRWGTTGANCTLETGTFTYSESFIKNTLSWGIYQNAEDRELNSQNVWWFDSDGPKLFMQKTHCLTVVYFDDGAVCEIDYSIVDKNNQYSLIVPEKIGHTPDRTIVSGTVIDDTFEKVYYFVNSYQIKFNYITESGKKLGSYTARYEYGTEYSHEVPPQIGCTARETVISGVMPYYDTEVDVIYDTNNYNLTINYLYSDSGEVALPSQVYQVKFGENYAFDTPEITGYTASMQTASGTMYDADVSINVYYGKNTYVIKLVYLYEDGTTALIDTLDLSYGYKYNLKTQPPEGYDADKQYVTGVVSENTTHYITCTPKTYTLTIDYVFAADYSKAAETYTASIRYGDSYVIESPQLEKYLASRILVSGTMPSHDEHIVVTYSSNTFTLKITYKYQDGSIIREEIYNVEYGTSYSIPSPSVKWYTPDKQLINGLMPSHDVSETVIYSKNVVSGAEGKCGDSLYWHLYEDGQLEISGSGEMYDYTYGESPWYSKRSNIFSVIIKDGVTSIGDYAFADCADFNGTYIPETVKNIGYGAFWGCSGITDISLTKNIETVEGGAFTLCTRLASVSVDSANDYLTVVDGILYTNDLSKLIYCYPDKRLNGFTLPQNVKEISDYAFFECYSLYEIILPESLEIVGDYAFGRCYNLQKVHFMGQNVSVGNNAFSESEVDSVIFEGSVKFIGNYAFSSICLKSVYFKGDVPAITGEYIFGNKASVIEKLCVYYPISNESWKNKISTVSIGNGQTRDFWLIYHAYAHCGIDEITLENASEGKIYALFIYCDKTPINEAVVTVNGQDIKTDSNGFVYFVYENSDKVSLKIYKENYNSLYDNVVDYKLLDYGVDYINLNTGSSLEGVTCFGNPIGDDLAYINVKYSGDIPIVVKGTTRFNIKKMQLVQAVPDSKNPDSGVLINKVLQTVYSDSSSLTEDGFCRFSVKASLFKQDYDHHYPIYAYMFTDSGEDTLVEELNIKLVAFKFNANFDNLFEETEFTLSDTGVEIFDNVKIKLESPLKCPLSFGVLNNELYLSWDLGDTLNEELKNMKTEVEGTTTNVKDALDDANTRAKNYLNKLTYKADEKIKSNRILKNKGHRSDFSLETGMAGGLCFVLGEKNSIQSIKSYVKLYIELDSSWTADYIVVILPITIELKASVYGEVIISGLGYDFENSRIMMPSVEANAEVSVQLGVGLGCRIASAGVFGRLSLSTSIALGERTYFKALSLVGDAGFYAKLNLGLFKLYVEKAWSVEKTWDFEVLQLVPETVDLLDESTNGYLGEYNGMPVYDLSSYSLRNTNVDMDDVEWSSNFAEEIESNTFEYANPKAVDLGDKLLVVYNSINSDRDDYNAQMLVYRLIDKNDGSFTEAKPVCDNGTSDSTFDLTVHNGKAYIVVIESNNVFNQSDYAGNSDDIQLMIDSATAQEVFVAEFDTQNSAFVNFQYLTDDEFYDHTPSIESLNGQLYVSWVSNHGSGNDMVFGMNSDNDVYLSRLTDSCWSTPECIVSDVNPISELLICSVDGKEYVAMIIDEDAYYYSNDDQNIYLCDFDGNITLIDCVGANVSNLTYYELGDKDTLLWYSSGKILAIDSVFEQPHVFVEADQSVTNNFKILQLTESVTAVVWSVNDIEDPSNEKKKAAFYGKFVDNEGEWSDTELFMSSAYRFMSYDVVVCDSDIEIVFVSTNISVSSTTGDIAMSSKLCYRFMTAGYDYVIGEVKIEPNYTNNTVSVSTTVHNKGIKSINQIGVVLKKFKLDSLGNVTDKVEDYYGVGLYQINLVPGDTCDLNFVASIIEGVSLENCAFSIVPFNGDQAAFEDYIYKLNNTFSISQIVTPSVGGNAQSSAVNDFEVDSAFVIIGKTPYLSVKVTNLGETSAYGTLNINRVYGDNDQYNDLIYSLYVDGLRGGSTKYLLIELKDSYFVTDAEKFVCSITDCSFDSNTANDSVTVYAKKPLNGDYTIKDDTAEASELSDYNGTFDKYESSDIELEIKPNGNEFVGASDIELSENIVYTENDDNSLILATVDEAYLDTLDVGDYEFTFYFLTHKGYIDCVYNLTVIDRTPIELVGDVDIVGIGKRGETLIADISKLNTDNVLFSWKANGVEVSTDAEYTVSTDDFGKIITVTVLGADVYFGSVDSEGLFIELISRSIKQPQISFGNLQNEFEFKNGFIVGDGVVEYGWSTVNDGKSVENWQTSRDFTIKDKGTYYLFVRVTGSSIYKDVISDGLLLELLNNWYLRGDFNNNGTIEAADAIYLVYFLLFPNAYPSEQCGDVDGNGQFDSDDSVYLLYHALFPTEYPLY